MVANTKTNQLLQDNISKDILVGGTTLVTTYFSVNPIISTILSVAFGIGWEIGVKILKGVIKNNELEERISEFLNFINLFNDYLEKEILNNNPDIISGLIILYDTLIKQRSKEKREKILIIFKGFIEAKDKEKFELEKMYHVLNLMSLDEILLLKKIYDRDKGTFRNNMRVFKSENKDERILYQFLNSLSIFIDEEHYLGRRKEVDVNSMHDTRTIPLNKYYFLTDFGNSFTANLYLHPNNPQAFGLTP